jgi:hypothetical protein
MLITKAIVAQRIIDYLRHLLTLEQLVLWAEETMMEGDFDTDGYDAIRSAIAHLGLADTRAFGLAWEDCEQMLLKLGYQAKLDFVAA